ncbi:hypothetical protein SBV1_320003 [Verrucomicrobia bacterium]|nr:hypothetical protein SBV1_320003 [Verrucomicrobiota bacterium]
MVEIVEIVEPFAKSATLGYYSAAHENCSTNGNLQ